MTDKNLQMLINVVCIESAPKVLEFTAMFSGLAGALASAMQNFAIEGDTDVDPHAHFDGAFDELIYEVHESIQGQSEYIRKKHNTELAELSQNGVVQQAHAIIERINHALPLLGRLDDILSTKDLLAYVSLKSNNSAHSSLIQDFLQCYASIIDKMEKDQQAEERHKQQQISELYDAIVNNTSDTVVQKIEAGVDLEAQVESSGKTPLALAIAKESADVASALIKLGAEPVKSSEGLSPLHIAANRKNGKLLCTLIASNHTSLDSVNWAELFIRNMDDALLNGFAKIFYKIDEDSHIRLAHTAIVEKSSKVLDCLLRHGLDSGSEYRAEKLTETAIEHDNSEALNVLLRNGEDKNSLIENNSNSLLATAIKQDKQSCIEVLLEKKAEIITYYMDESFTYLEKLAELLGGSVETLLKASVINPCRAHKNGRSLMHFAIEKKDISWLKMLNENFDLDLNQKTEQDKVPLLMTEAQDKIEYLIANGANVSAKINDTPILGEIKSEFIPLMLKAGANPNVSRFRMPLLHRAVCDGEDYVELLIEKGADVNAKDDSGRTVVESQLKTPEKLEPYLLALINAGFDFSQEARPGLPLCHALCVLFSPEHILAASKEKTFDVNALDINGNNSLMQACFAGKMENVKTLLALGANVNCSSKLGLTALAFAIYQNNESLVKLLVENGADVLHKFASLNAERLATKLGRTQLVPLLKPQGLMRKFKEILNI